MSGTGTWQWRLPVSMMPTLTPTPPHFTLLDIRREDCLDGKKRPSHEKTAYCVCLRMHEILLYYRATFVDFVVDTVHVVIEQHVWAAPIYIALKSAIVGMLYGKFGIGGGNPRFSIKYMPARRKFDCLASPEFASCLADYVNAHDDVEMPDHDLKKKSVVVSTAQFINSFATAAASCTGGLFAIDERSKQRATLEQIFTPDSSLVGKKRPRRGGKGRGKGKLDDVCDVLLQICTEVVAGGAQAQKKRKSPRSCPHVVIIDDYDDGSNSSNSGSGSGSRGGGSDHPHGGCSSEGGVEVEDGSLDLQLARETSASVRTGSPTHTTNPTNPTNPTTTTTTESESESKSRLQSRSRPTSRSSKSTRSRSRSTRSRPKSTRSRSTRSTPGSARSRSPKRAARSAHPISSSSSSSSSRLRRTGDVVEIEIEPVPEPPCDPAAESSESFQ